MKRNLQKGLVHPPETDVVGTILGGGKFMVKKIALLAVLALALPMAAFATSFDSQGGTLAGSSSGLTLSGSTLVFVNGLYGNNLSVGSNLGSISLTTGALTGSLATGGTFASGGTITITGNGINGVPTGVIFTGTFSSPVIWAVTPGLPNGTNAYSLTGTISGTLSNGFIVKAGSLTLNLNAHKGFFSGSASVDSVDLNVAVPEPGTLSLFGTGLIGLAGILRRKLNLV
jgi:hypothetical protein